jgi:hypothetical protein
MKNNLSLFIKNKTIILRELESELELRIKNANDKEYAKSSYISELKPVYQNLQNNLGELSKFNDFIKEKKRLNKNFDEINEYNKLKLDEIKKIAIKEAHKEFLDSYYSNETKENAINKTELKWLGKDYLEFIILFKSLHESGIIKDETQTLLITNIAKFFNYELSNNWESILSDNLKNTLDDYEPPIISKIRNGYQSLKSKSKSRRKKNKPQ